MYSWPRRAIGWAYRSALLALIALCPALHAQSQRPQTPLRIAAAADLQPVLPAILLGFERQTGRKAEASFASSATLATQIENGAPFDVILSANMALPEKIARDGLAAADFVTTGSTANGKTVQAYARGTLVLWTRNGTRLDQLAMPLLSTSGVHSIAIANPDHAPYGRAAREALTSLGLWPAVQPKLRTAENIAQAAQFASTGNADVGLISLTYALTLTGQGHYILVPASAYTPIVQGAVTLRRSANPQDAAAFLRYLHTPDVGRQLQQGGLEPLP